MRIILNSDQEIICESFDSTFIASNVRHELINQSEEEVQALIIYESANVTRTFIETGEIVEICSSKDNFASKK